MSRCAICGRKVYDGEYRDYYDPSRKMTLLICNECEMPKSSPRPIRRDDATLTDGIWTVPKREIKKEMNLTRPGKRK